MDDSSSSASEEMETTEFVNGEEKEVKPPPKKKIKTEASQQVGVSRAYQEFLIQNARRLQALKERIRAAAGVSNNENINNSASSDSSDESSEEQEEARRVDVSQMHGAIQAHKNVSGQRPLGDNTKTVNGNNYGGQNGHGTSLAVSVARPVDINKLEFFNGVQQPQTVRPDPHQIARQQKLDYLQSTRKYKIIQIQALESQASVCNPSDPAYYAFFSRTALLRNEVADLDRMIASLM